MIVTTVVIDILHNKVVTDGRVTENVAIKLKKAWFLSLISKKYDPWIRERTEDDTYYNKFYRLKADCGQTVFCCAAGRVDEIQKFLKLIKNKKALKKFPKKYLENSSVIMIKFQGENRLIYNAKNSTISKVDAESWITIGSGGDVACGVLETVSEQDKNRAVKAVQTAIHYDNDSGGEPRVYELKEFDDIY